ncbi:unnamed protein product [Leptidea sinapis]|uniref:Uncharacterized protein n=1 Tax=Leptidea sinapis TaxID=189913 RepID=A0A5E4PRJ4_9NEOP|nr:unnamed protein product [Leptidea sinapis]
MGEEINTETNNMLLEEIKRIQEKCFDVCNVFQNSRIDIRNSGSVVDKALSYAHGLSIEIQNSNTSIYADQNLIASQFLSEIKTKSDQVDELIAFTTGAINDIDREIARVSNLTRTAKAALTQPRIVHRDVHPEHMEKAKETFHILKTELQGLIKALYPSYADDVMEFIRELMMEQLNEESSGYLTVTKSNFRIVTLLSDMNILTTNPYNKSEL